MQNYAGDSFLPLNARKRRLEYGFNTETPVYHGFKLYIMEI
jgi:hypothetical protein